MDKQIPYIGRRSYCTHDTMEVHRFSMCFTFVWIGCEGLLMTNMFSLRFCGNQNLNFPYPRGGECNK